MRSLKFRKFRKSTLRALVGLIFLVLGPVLGGVPEFDFSSCLKLDFDVTVTRPGWPWGLHTVTLGIKKDSCQVDFRHEKLRFVERFWQVDLCRHPIHLKVGRGVVDVYKRKGPCPGDSSYCREISSLSALLENDGLIFAQGKRDDLSSDYGKVQCVYGLLKRYLFQGELLSPSSGPTPEREQTPDPL